MMDNRTRSALLILFFMIGMTGSLSASGLFDSEVSIDSAPSLVSGSYDCLEELVITDAVTVGSSGIAGYYALGFSAGSSGSFANRQAVSGNADILDYQIYDSATTREVIMDLNASPDASSLLTGTAYVGGTDVNFDVAVFEGQVMPPGTYDDTVAIYLYEGNNGEDGLKETDSMAISIEVPAFVAVSVVNSGGDFDALSDSMDLDFGSIEEGVSRQMDVVVLANINYTVLLESSNGGVLANLDVSDTSTVPYELEVEGGLVDLSSGQVGVIWDSGPTSLSGNAYNFEFTIGDPGGASSGSYEDIVTVTVTAQ